MLKDPASTRFILVMRAAAVLRIETERFLQRLRRLELNVPMVVVNALTLRPGACAWCNAIAAAERRELARVQAICRRRPQRCAIIATPLAVPPPRGIPALGRWARTWIA
jgi:anion-transporting  ArsA/GET3 family ATPase